MVADGLNTGSQDALRRSSVFYDIAHEVVPLTSPALYTSLCGHPELMPPEGSFLICHRLETVKQFPGVSVQDELVYVTGGLSTFRT